MMQPCNNLLNRRRPQRLKRLGAVLLVIAVAMFCAFILAAKFMAITRSTAYGIGFTALALAAVGRIVRLFAIGREIRPMAGSSAGHRDGQ